MKNNNLKKRICKAINTECNKTEIKLINTILYYSSILPTVKFSQAVLARMIGLKSKNSRIQVSRIIQKFKRLDILRVISGQKTHETNIYIPNPILFKLSVQFKNILSACKQYLVDKVTTFLDENVTPYINNIKSQFNSSVFFSSNNFLKIAGTLDTAMTYEEHMFNNNISYFKEDMDLNKKPINQLTDEEWEIINTPKTKQQIRQEKEELTKKVITIEREIKHLGKKESHPFFAQYKFPGA